jgi:hypothetical protein
MLGINGNRVWCRTTEEKILQSWEDLSIGKCKRISIRDSLVFKENGIIDYVLWNTTLVKADKDRKNVYIYIASHGCQKITLSAIPLSHVLMLFWITTDSILLKYILVKKIGA